MFSKLDLYVGRRSRQFRYVWCFKIPAALVSSPTPTPIAIRKRVVTSATTSYKLGLGCKANVDVPKLTLFLLLKKAQTCVPSMYQQCTNVCLCLACYRNRRYATLNLAIPLLFSVTLARVAQSACRNIAFSVLVFQLLLNSCRGLVETCEELQAAFDLTKTQDVEIEMYPFQQIDCVNFTTMSMDSNTLTVSASVDNLENYHGSCHLYEVRFEVTNGATLYWETNVEFNGPSGEDVNGGGIFVGEGSTVRFLNDMEMTDVGVRSVTDESSDFSSNDRSGGCVYNDGYFRVDGDAVFTSCDVTGGGESSPGPGGGLYVGEEGSVLFNGKLEMSSISITDDEGGDGGAIYNAGKVNIKGSTRFESIRARDGGAIYNAAGAEIQEPSIRRLHRLQLLRWHR